MGLLVFLFVTAAILPALLCLASFFLFEELFHCRFCTWSYFWAGAGLGIWQLWRASRPGSEVSYANGIIILVVTNLALAVYLYVQHRRGRREIDAAAAGDSGGNS